jgi:hypothetical protein
MSELEKYKYIIFFLIIEKLLGIFRSNRTTAVKVGLSSAELIFQLVHDVQDGLVEKKSAPLICTISMI